MDIQLSNSTLVKLHIVNNVMVSSGLVDTYHFKSKSRRFLENGTVDTSGSYGEFTCNRGRKFAGCMHGWSAWNRDATQDADQITTEDFCDIVSGESGKYNVSDIGCKCFTCL